MQLSTKGRYAVMAMADLASREPADGTTSLTCLSEIAGRQQRSQSYLEQLFGKLRRAGLVVSSRGPGGGYHLARPPSAIADAEIVLAVEEPITATRCVVGSGGCLAMPAPATRGEKCQTHDLWFELERQIVLFLSAITLADIVQGRVAGRAVCLLPIQAGQDD